MDASERGHGAMWRISEDGRVDRLVVYLTVDGQPVPVGAITVEGKGHVRQSSFAYARSWLERGVAISPALPLRSRAVVSAPHELPLPFYDAAPEGWGRNVLTAAFPRQVFGMAEFLAAAGDERTGDLRFGPTPDSGPMQWVPQDDPRFTLPDEAQTLQDLLDAAEAVDAGEATLTHLRRLFRSSADTGGARPKARLTLDGADRQVPHLGRRLRRSADRSIVSRPGPVLRDRRARSSTGRCRRTFGVATALAEALRRMLGDRNIAVHDYQTLHVPITIAVIERHLGDVLAFGRTVLGRLRPSP